MNFTQFRAIMEHPHLRNQAEFSVLIAMVHHARPDNDAQAGLCWAGRDTIAHEARVSVRCAEQVLERLTKRGFLTLVEKGGGKGKKTVYRLHVEQGKPEKHVPKEQPYSEPPSPYETPKGEPHSANVNVYSEPHSANEDSHIRRSSFDNDIEEGERDTRASPPPEPSSSPWPPELEVAVREVTQIPLTFNWRDRKAMETFSQFVLGQCDGDVQRACAETRRRFRRPAWRWRRLPTVEELAQQWHRQDDAINFEQQQKGGTEKQNDNRNQQSTPSVRERRHSERAALRSELLDE